MGRGRKLKEENGRGKINIDRANERDGKRTRKCIKCMDG